MRKRDKTHTMKLPDGATVETLLMPRARQVRMVIRTLMGDGLTVWLTPAKLRRMAKRLNWCADVIERKHRAKSPRAVAA